MLLTGEELTQPEPLTAKKRVVCSWTVSNWRGATLVNCCTFPLGHSMRSKSMFVASPKPKMGLSEFCVPKPSPPDTSRNCVRGIPPILAETLIFAPMAERLEAVPMHLTFIHWLLLALL